MYQMPCIVSSPRNERTQCRFAMLDTVARQPASPSAGGPEPVQSAGDLSGVGGFRVVVVAVAVAARAVEEAAVTVVGHEGG